MQILLIVILVLVVLLFGLSSISQSYATAKEAQAAIEVGRAAQIASTGNLVSLVTVAVVIVAILVAVVLITWLYLRAKGQSKRNWFSGPDANWGQVSQPQVNELLPVLLSMMLYQVMLSQQHQQETEQLWMMNEPINDLPSFPDNAWDM